MARQKRIYVGCRVIGSHGPLVTNPNVSVKRRVRSKVVGTIMKAVGQQKWDVQFDFDGIVKEGVSSTSLQIVEADVGITLDEINNTNNNSAEQVSILEFYCLTFLLLLFLINWNAYYIIFFYFHRALKWWSTLLRMMWI